jgi:thiol-disulfide isomerase/thioredoxin
MDVGGGGGGGTAMFASASASSSAPQATAPDDWVTPLFGNQLCRGTGIGSASARGGGSSSSQHKSTRQITSYNKSHGTAAGGDGDGGGDDDDGECGIYTSGGSVSLLLAPRATTGLGLGHGCGGGGRLVMVLFSASWCKACKVFVPLLNRACEQYVQQQQKRQYGHGRGSAGASAALSCVFVSADSTRAAFDRYYAELLASSSSSSSSPSWLALPYGAGEGAKTREGLGRVENCNSEK